VGVPARKRLICRVLSTARHFELWRAVGARASDECLGMSALRHSTGNSTEPAVAFDFPGFLSHTELESAIIAPGPRAAYSIGYFAIWFSARLRTRLAVDIGRTLCHSPRP